MVLFISLVIVMVILYRLNAYLSRRIDFYTETDLTTKAQEQFVRETFVKAEIERRAAEVHQEMLEEVIRQERKEREKELDRISAKD